MNSDKQPMLAPYRVLDLTDEWGFLCGRLLADLGADVIKIEKPGGDPSRNIGPFYHDIPHPEKSLFWYFYNANKRGITLDIETSDGKEIFKRLASKADFVIESFPPGYMNRLGLGYSALSKANPGIIVTSITPFGGKGPYSKYKSSDIINMALCGWMLKCGDADRAPLQMGAPYQSHLHAASQAIGGALAALYHRGITGKGQRVEVTPMPTVIGFAQSGMRWYVTKKCQQRHGRQWDWTEGPLIRYVWECKDGAVCFSMMGGARFTRALDSLIDWMDSEGMAPAFLKEMKWDKVNFNTIAQEFRDRFESPVIEFFKTKTKAELFRESVKRGITLFPANNARELLQEPQLISRGYWIDVEHPELGTNLTYPGAFFKSSETVWKMKRRAPLIGEHNQEIYMNELGFSKDELIVLKQNNVI